jgi:hypothetical protein
MAPCPIGVCDCDPHTAKGTMADVATYLGASDVWAAGFRGTGIVVGVVDGGTLAVGRATPSKVPRVIGGWPTADWGTVAQWGEHGCMTSTDVLGMAPDAQIFDIRIADAPDPTGLISNALAGFQWAIDQHKLNGTPQVLTNSWGIFQQSWDPAYATDPNHPFTRKVLEAIAEGIVILFAAGNCGNTCPDGRCGPDNGPGRDIWGANGHPSVMTVGAVNRNEEFVGYSSVGPAALDPNKPDFCSVTHFAGYFPTVNPSEPADSGTSAATPIAAGIVALLKQGKPSATQDEIKNVLKSTAKDIGPPGWDQYSGAGIIRAKAAFDALRGVGLPKKPLDDVGGKKVHDDAPAKKLQDDGPKKVQDDVGSKKVQDDVGSKKLRDDGPAKKLRDDGPKKLRDDVGGKKLRDDGPKKLRDDGKKLRDDGGAKKLRDDGGAKKLRDDGQGKKLRDDGPGKKLRDDGPRKKFLDDAGVSALQAGQSAYFGYYGESPFILSTPHHAEVYQAEEASYAEAALVAETETLMSGYENAIAEMEQQLEELRAEYASALEQHRAVIEAYQQGSGG